jgi:hypothetical protein
MAGKPDTRELAQQHNPLEYLTTRYWVAVGAVRHRPRGRARRPWFCHRGGQRHYPDPVRHGTRKGPPAVVFPPPYPGRGHRLCRRARAYARAAVDLYPRRRARIRVSRRGAGLSVVLIYLAVNVSAVRAFRTEFRDDFRFCRHLLIPATAIVFLLFPSGDPSPARPDFDEPAAVRGAGMALPGRYRRRRPADPAAGGITRARVTTFHDGPTGWSHEFRRF